MPFAGHTTDGLHDPLRWRFRMHGFLSHLHSLMVTMSQKSFVPQAAKSVSQELMSDTREKLSKCTGRPERRLQWDLRAPPICPSGILTPQKACADKPEPQKPTPP